MSETQFPRSLFPQFTEAQLEEISKRFKSSVNWTKYNKWVEDGEPFVEHDEIIDQNGSSPRSPDGKSIDFYPFCYFIFMYIFDNGQTYKFFLKEPNNVMLTEIEDFEMEAALSIVPGRRIKRPGKEAMEHLPLQEPRPPLVTSVNIVVKILDPVNFPTLSNYARQMIQDLQRDNILNEVIGRNIKGEVREYKFDKASSRMKIIGSKINSYNIVPKESYIYAMTLPNNHYLMLRHLRVTTKKKDHQRLKTATSGGTNILNRLVLFEQTLAKREKKLADRESLLHQYEKEYTVRRNWSKRN
ncbi:14485_t:CDS:2 [Rhizophagus irregularis]|nr:14485_t:CDS:2 [Rhizophagus irregularis]